VYVRPHSDTKLPGAELTDVAYSLLVSRPGHPWRVIPPDRTRTHEPTMTDELISRTTRGLFRSLMTGSTVGEIGAAFQDEGFAAKS
jgi:hypothetical protein